MGYAGGTTPNPTYHKIGDHAECIEVDFDPEVISFQEILVKFWEWHNAFGKPYARQYMSAVFYHSEAQRAAVESDVGRFAALGKSTKTEVAPWQSFALAEDYHQKYYLRRHREAAAEFKALYPNLLDFIGAYSTMRVNALLGGYLELDEQELRSFGLSDKVVAMVKPKVSLMNRLGLLR